MRKPGENVGHFLHADVGSKREYPGDWPDALTCGIIARLRLPTSTKEANAVSGENMAAVFADAGKTAAGAASPSEVIGKAFEKLGSRKKETGTSELARKRKANELKKSLRDSLQRRGLTEKIYSDMVDDYLELWWTRAKLEDDIRERGVLVYDAKRGLDVENCAVSARVRVSAQMAKLYKALGCQELATKNQAPDGEDDEL